MNVLDLFSGICGFTLGLERAGMKTIAFCENDEACKKVIKKHYPGVPVFNDVKKMFRPSGVWSKEKWDNLKQDIDVVCGGFPCQDISVAGQKKGLKGERSGLWAEFKRIIKKVEPRYAIIENVANLRNMGLTQVIKDLWEIGYACEWHIISARSVGACHLRERIWIIAYPDSQVPRGLPIGEKTAHTMFGSPYKYDVTYPYVSRLWKPFASEKEKSEWWAETTISFRGWWETQSKFCRMDDELPRGLDKGRRERIKQLGNAVVPAIPELIGRAIMDYESRKSSPI